MNIDLIAGYIFGRLEKKFWDKNNEYSGEILFYARMYTPDCFFPYGTSCRAIFESVVNDWDKIESQVNYLISLCYNEQYITSRNLKITPKYIEKHPNHIVITYHMSVVQ